MPSLFVVFLKRFAAECVGEEGSRGWVSISFADAASDEGGLW